MDAGKLDRKIQILQISKTKDAWNFDVKTQSVFADAWAKRVDVRPSEEVEESQIVAITRTEWWVRYLSGVTREMVVKYEGQEWAIVGIQEKGRREWLILTTEMREKDEV